MPRNKDLVQVLLVEDNPGDSLLVREMLADAEFSTFEVHTVATLSEAIVNISKMKFAIALLDLTLPDSAGIDTFVRLRNNAKQMPIIILTGLEDHETAFDALDLGAQDFLSKNHLDTFTLERSINYAVSRKKLEEQNLLQAAALQSAANAVFITDHNGIIEWVNAAFVAMTGYRPDEVIGRPPSIFGADAFSTEIFMNSLKDILDDNKVWRHELHNRCKDGRIIIVEQTITPFAGANNAVTNFVAIQQDITQRKIDQEELQRYSEMLEKVNRFSRILSESLDQGEIVERLKTQIFTLIPEIHKIQFSKFDLVLQDFQKDVDYVNPEADQNKAVKEEQATQFSVPMIAQDSVVGMISLLSNSAEAFNATNTHILGIIGNTAAVAIENAQLFEQTQRQISRLNGLRAIDIAITSSSDLVANLEVLVEQVMAQFEADAASILLLTPETGLLKTAVSTGFNTGLFENSVLHLGESIAGKAAAEHKVICIPDFDKEDNNFIPSAFIGEEGFRAYFGVPLIVKNKFQGVLEIFHRKVIQPDKEGMDFLEALAGQAAIAIDNAQLFSSLQKSNLELRNAYDITIEGWSRAVELRDVETDGHTRRVAQLTMELVDRMGLPEEDKLHIRRGAILHDVGKIGVPDQILFKAGKLDENEWAIMRTHPVLAYEMLMKIEYLQPAIQIPYSHHERWDGSGYPRGLKEADIPIEARIFAIVDVYDALTSDRPYRKAWPEEKAIQHIVEQSGKHFDPVVVNVFLQFLQNRSIGEEKRSETGELVVGQGEAFSKRVVIVEDSEIIRQRLKEVILGIEGLTVVAEGTNTEEALRLVNYLNASIYILDIRMPGDGGGMAVLELLKSRPHPPTVIVFTSFANERYRQNFKTAGADYFFDKTTDMDELVQTLSELAIFDQVAVG